MKKVWILEVFRTAEDLVEDINRMQSFLDDCISRGSEEDAIKACERVVDKCKENLANNPSGMWQGTEGKTNYRVFCQCASDAIRRSPKSKFRVLKAELPDEAKYWVGYSNGVVNDGVLRYLRAVS